MKKHLLLLMAAWLLSIIPAVAQTVDGRNFGIDGFAAYAGTPGTNHYLAGGTTGGQGGDVVKADNFSQLQAYLQSSKPYIILVDHDITTGITCYIESSSIGYLCANQDGTEGVPSTYGERIMVAPNKTLIGIADASGNAPLFSRITFVMQCCSNVIIRNCRFTMVGAPILKVGENKIVAWRDGEQKEVGDPDCIGIQADANSAKTDWGAHIWIDHCEFFNGDAGNKDRYDGLVDCKNNVQWLTISYNLFHDHDKACLWGKGDSDVYDNCRTISAHHNYFKNIQGSRLPLQRGGNVHYMNNYQDGCQDGWDLRTKSVGYADACYFKGGKAPILPDGGGVVNINSDPEYGIVYDACTRRITGHAGITELNITKTDAEFPASQYVTGTWVPTDTWAGYYVNNHDKVMDVPEICEKYSGAGKIVIWNGYIPEADAAKFQEACATQLTAAVYDENGNKIAGVAGGGSETDAGGDSNDEVLFKLAVTAKSNVSIKTTTDVTSLSSYATITGGTASMGLSADPSDGKEQKIIGKENNIYQLRTPHANVYVKLTLDKALAAGDRITFSGTSASGTELRFVTTMTDTNTNEATNEHTYTIPAGSPLIGQTEIYAFRASASKTYIQTLTIIRPANDDETQDDTPTGINTIDNTSAPLQMKVRKIMEDGRIVIEKNGNKYTTTGIKI